MYRTGLENDMGTNGHKKKRNMMQRVIILCLWVCLVLGVGISYARYRTDLMTISYWFKSSYSDTIVMRGIVTSDSDAKDGIWNLVPDSWQNTQWDIAKLDFSVSNGSSDKAYASRDQLVTIQLVASLNIQNPENLRISIVTLDDQGKEVIYDGVPAEIRKGSLLHSLYGDGWVYTFVDETENQKDFLLKGNRLSYQNFTVFVEGNVDATLLSIELNGAYVNSN